MNAFAAALDNRTPFPAESFVIPDPRGQEALIVVMSASFQAPLDALAGPLVVAEDQRVIHAADVHRGDPASTSVIHESVVALRKPFVDVLVNGHAYGPERRAAQQIPVRLVLGDVDKTLLVSGDRRWNLGLPSAPEPFIRVPIIWERAFGGTSARGRVDPRNPIGVGCGGAVSDDPEVRTEVPNIEYPQQTMSNRASEITPAGFGVVGRGWRPRIDFAGTYDQRWLDSQWPLLPVDFDPRHYQSAPADQQSQTLRGGEEGAVVNMSEDGVWHFRLPLLDVPAHLLYDDRQAVEPMRMDTVVIEPDERRVTILTRVVVETRRDAGMLRQVVLGHMLSSWLRAAAHRKHYIGSDGTDRRRPLFVA